MIRDVPQKDAIAETLGKALSDLGFLPKDEGCLLVRKGRSRNRLTMQEAEGRAARPLPDFLLPSERRGPGSC